MSTRIISLSRIIVASIPNPIPIPIPPSLHPPTGAPKENREIRCCCRLYQSFKLARNVLIVDSAESGVLTVHSSIGKKILLPCSFHPTHQRVAGDASPLGQNAPDGFPFTPKWFVSLLLPCCRGPRLYRYVERQSSAR